MSKPAAQILLELLSGLSLRNQYRFADLVSFFVNHIPNQLARQARENIQLCFAEESQAWQKRLARESIRHTSYSLFELAAVWCWPASRILAVVDEQQVSEAFSASSKGKIVIAPHLGSWELLNIWLAQRGETLSLYRPLRNPGYAQFVLDSRSRNGAELVPTTTAGLRKLLRGLQQGSTLMLLTDQKPAAKKNSVDAAFFGRQASTTTLVNSLARKVDCDVFIAAACRSEPAAKFDLVIQPLQTERLAGEARASTQYMNDQIELLARQCPAQYQWTYRRFTANEYKQL